MRKQFLSRYFFILSFLIIVSSTFPLVKANIWGIFTNLLFWSIVWFLSLLLFYPKVLFSGIMKYVIIYGLYLFIALNTFLKNMDRWNSETLIWEFYQIALTISIFNYFILNKEFHYYAKITKYSIVFLIITCFTTLFTTFLEPNYGRMVAGTTQTRIDFVIITGLSKYGAGNYGTMISYLGILIIIVYFMRFITNNIFTKIIFIFLLLIVIYTTIRMQIYANIILAFLFSFFAFLNPIKLKKSLLIVFFTFILIFSIPKSIFVDSLLEVSYLFDETTDISKKFRETAFFINYGFDLKETQTNPSQRVERYPILFETFMRNPFFGCYFFSDETGRGYQGEGAHLHWMNKLTIMGIIGFIIFSLIIFKFIQSNLKNFKLPYKYYYILGSLSIISYGILKTIAGIETWITLFIILPGVYYLTFLNIKTENKIFNVDEQQNKSSMDL